jgi:hypothetical protein
MSDIERDGVPCKTTEDGQTLGEQTAAVYRRAQVPRLPLLEENERLRRQLMGAVEALREIAEADPVDLVLDPTWAARVAREAWWKATGLPSRGQ